ncbi:hypothetical protein CSOJ01_11486 [Colletotrichum sojae]|uniref:Uncharacterized protein n=1 Tax=Colletotrichum sojae TaxID=2175907 RepID=A0A8H6IY25_9PEZI|nr:hypothetical protein CSOJ01_11486 [Colletotrichum sojae]
MSADSLPLHIEVDNKPGIWVGIGKLLLYDLLSAVEVASNADLPSARGAKFRTASDDSSIAMECRSELVSTPPGPAMPSLAASRLEGHNGLLELLDKGVSLDISSLSNTTTEDLGLKEGRSLVPGKACTTAVPVDARSNTSKYGIPNFVRDGAPVFSLGRNRWVDGQGVPVASMHEAADGQHSLVVTVALPRAQLDLLVALWCCKVWESEVAKGRTMNKGIDKGRSSC